jgi:hypothetical protein
MNQNREGKVPITRDCPQVAYPAIRAQVVRELERSQFWDSLFQN